MTRYILMLGLLVSLLLIQGNTKPKYSEVFIKNVDEASEILNSYDSLLNNNQVPAKAFVMVYKRFKLLLDRNIITNDSIITIIDYSKASDQERFFVLDIKNKHLVNKTLVAHGQRSGTLYAESFSNQVKSHKSSLGFFRTSNTYEGKHGYSLLLEGLDKGLNDNAFERSIVIHGANYVSYNYIEQNGRLGRSFGCPAISYEISEQIIDLIKNGSCLFIYHPSISSKYLS